VPTVRPFCVNVSVFVAAAGAKLRTLAVSSPVSADAAKLSTAQVGERIAGLL